jgi:hypothetical protein
MKHSSVIIYQIEKGENLQEEEEDALQPEYEQECVEGSTCYLSTNKPKIQMINSQEEEVDDDDVFLFLEQEEVEEQLVVEQDLQEGYCIEPFDDI